MVGKPTSFEFCGPGLGAYASLALVHDVRNMPAPLGRRGGATLWVLARLALFRLRGLDMQANPTDRQVWQVIQALPHAHCHLAAEAPFVQCLQ